MQCYTGLFYCFCSSIASALLPRTDLKRFIRIEQTFKSITSTKYVALTAFACELLPRQRHLFVFSVVCAYLLGGAIVEVNS